MADPEDVKDSFTRPRAVPAEGARIGLMSCLACGAALVLDPSDRTDMAALHYQWHLQLEDEQAPTSGRGSA